MKPFDLGVKDGLEQGDAFGVGVTWPDPDKNEEYDRGVNVGQALRRLNEALQAASDCGALDHMTEVAGHPDTTNGFCDDVASAIAWASGNRNAEAP